MHQFGCVHHHDTVLCPVDLQYMWLDWDCPLLPKYFDQVTHPLFGQFAEPEKNKLTRIRFTLLDHK